MGRVRASAAILMFAAASPAGAAELKVLVLTRLGAPVPNAVVTAYPAAGDHDPTPSTEPLIMAQKDIAFTPYVLVAPVGSAVTFPNRDTVRHHVYSFSPAHRFELKLYGREEHRTERFDKVGVVAIGCNIHDKMAAYIDVVDTRFAEKTDADGRASIAGLPGGPLTLKVWSPNAKGQGGVASVALGAGISLATVTLDVRPPIPGKQDH